MREPILEALKKSPADYTEVRHERVWRSEVTYRGADLVGMQAGSSVGGIVRCLLRGAWGVALWDDLASLPERIEEACRRARVTAERMETPVQLAPVEPVQDEVRLVPERGPYAVSLEQKQALLQSYNDMMRRFDERIVTTEARYRDAVREVTLATSEGTWLVQEWPDVTLYLAATAGDGDAVQTAFEADGWAGGLDLLGGTERAERAARRAVELLSAGQVRAGTYSVVLSPTLTGLLIGRPLGRLCEADRVLRDARLQALLQPGQRLGPPTLQVVDNGFLRGRRGNLPYDDEGVPRTRTTLVQDGVLVGLLHNRETAGRLGLQPTGNARAVSAQFAPLVRLRNIYVDRGPDSVAGLFAGIAEGIYACGIGDLQTYQETFSLRVAYGYRIVNGQMGEMLRGMVLKGDLLEVLGQIEGIADDLELYGFSTDAKEGQEGLLMTSGGPHVRIRQVRVEPEG